MVSHLAKEILNACQKGASVSTERKHQQCHLEVYRYMNSDQTFSIRVFRFSAHVY